MLSSRDNWIVGTPDQVSAQLASLAQAGVDRGLLSVNCDLHREMLPLLGTLAA
jgi:alkanesulfonate monooxygenase SsuD/methylene tetrahydromethanopterin reductase-like flavin-dependent oxidoreductase (luciferase family)